MDELLEAAKKQLQAGKPETALSILKQAGNEKPEYARMMAICRNTLSEQYVYLIKEHLNRSQLPEAQKVIEQYQATLGTDGIIRSFINEIEQKAAADNGWLNRIAGASWGKTTNIAILSFAVLTIITFFLSYVADEEGYALLFGSIAGLFIQASCFVLYLALAKNVIWRIDQRAIVNHLFATGFSLIVLSQLLELFGIYFSYGDYIWAPALSVWNLSGSIKFAYKYWEYVSWNNSLWTLLMGILNTVSCILYITAFSQTAKYGKSICKEICNCGIMLLTTECILLLVPYSNSFSFVYIAGMVVAFALWLRLFRTIRKTQYINF